MKFNSAVNLQQLAQKDKYWRQWDSRWEYMSIVIAWLQFLEPKTVLEAGCNNAPVCLDSDTIGLNDDTDIIHDLTNTPWPFKDKQYDVFIALQVWEHLKDKQKQAFVEAERVSNNIILSFPYVWNRPGNCHHRITEDTILKWSLGRLPNKTFITNETTQYKRMICYWENK